MAKHFGIPYMGSKDKIALDILRQLPKGKRFVDLFGGGFAMSHAAFLSNRYESVLYQDFNPLLPELIRKAINNEYSYENFKPRFISREDFEALKDKDGYIRYVWSFGNKGTNYMFGKDVEPLKRDAHNFVVFGRWTNSLQKILPEAYRVVTSNDITTRRKQFVNCAKNKIDQLKHSEQLERLERLQQLERLERLQQLGQLERLQQLERLERLQQLERLERLQQLGQLERLQQLEIKCGDYGDYEYQDGDIVYCDPPYEGTADYGSEFSSQEFYDWCYSRPYQVWFSSYKISDKRFKVVWARQLRGVLGKNNNSVNFECLYTNK